MDNLYELNGTYGSQQTPCTILVLEQPNGIKWHCVEGGSMVNATYDDLYDGIDIETTSDCDVFTWSDSIEDLDQLEHAVNY